MTSKNSPLIVVAGPTGSGKSDLGLFLATLFHGEIVNCDSVQVYRHLNIGSAKLPVSARRGIPHHLIDILELDQELTAGSYARLARQTLQEIRGRNRLPIIVGGTGLYLRAVLEGLSPAPSRNEEIRSRLRFLAVKRPFLLHRFLRRKDPATAERIHPNDHQKLIRAIEMVASTGQPASATQSRPRNALAGFDILKLGLLPERTELRDRLNERTRQMFTGGLVQETRALLDAGCPPSSKALLSLGYKQAVEVLNGHATVEDAIAEAQTRTRQYAKRQITWFRAGADIAWLRGFGTDPRVWREAAELVKPLLLSTCGTFVFDSGQLE